MSIKIIFADDHEIFHDCVKALFDSHGRIEVLATVSDGRAAVRLAKELKPDVVVMDLAMPFLNGFDATRRIATETPGVKVVALSSHKDRKFILSMLRAGARGYVVKDSVIAELVQAIEVVVSGGMYLSPGVTDIVMNNLLHGDEEGASSPFDKLTPRERETLQLLVEGTPIKDIADLLNVSSKTVETHRHNIMQKLGVESLPELTKLAIREGLTVL